MKKRLLIILSIMAIIGTLTACGSSNSTSSASADNVTAVSTESVEVTSEYSELTIKTDWEEMATIAISDSEVSIDGSGATESDGVITITEGGSYTISGQSSECQIVVNTDENVKLILNGVDLTSATGPVIYGQQVKNLYIELADGTTNTLTDSSTYATDSSTGETIGKGTVSCEDDLIILGEGTLNVTANYDHAIVSDDKLYIEAGTINILSTVKDGLHANDLICIDGGTIDINSTSDMMESEDMLVINGGTITGTSEGEGIESKNAIYVNGGTIDITTYDDGMNATSYIEINDGDITIYSEYNDALDSNGRYEGCITINGGTLNLTSAGDPEEPIDTDGAGEIINGGDVTTATNGNRSMGQGGGPGQGDGPMGGGQMPDQSSEDGSKPQMNGGKGQRGGFDQQNPIESDSAQ